MEGVLGVNPIESGVTFTSDNIKQKMEAVGAGSYLIGLNPNFRSSTSFPHSAMAPKLHPIKIYFSY